MCFGWSARGRRVEEVESLIVFLCHRALAHSEIGIGERM